MGSAGELGRVASSQARIEFRNPLRGVIDEDRDDLPEEGVTVIRVERAKAVTDEV